MDLFSSQLHDYVQKEVYEQLCHSTFPQNIDIGKSPPTTQPKAKQRALKNTFKHLSRHDEMAERQPVLSEKAEGLDTEVGLIMETIKDDFNLKLQSLIEEVQNTVTLKDFDKKCGYFEDQMNSLRSLAHNPVPQPTNVQLVDLPKAHNEHDHRWLGERLSRLEESTQQLKGNLEQLISIYERDKLRQRTKAIALHVDQGDAEPVQQIGNHTISTRDKFAGQRGFLNLCDIENFDIFDDHSSQDSQAQGRLDTQDEYHIRSRPAHKLSASTGKLAPELRGGSSKIKTGKGLKQRTRDSPAVLDRQLAGVKQSASLGSDHPRMHDTKTRTTKDKVRALLGKPTSASKRLN